MERRGDRRMRAMMMTSHDCGDDDDNDDGCVNGQALFRASFPDCHTAIGEGVCVLVSECILIAGSWGLNGGPMSTGHVKTHLPLTSSHCAYKRIIYKSLTFKNCQLQGKCLRTTPATASFDHHQSSALMYNL